MLRGQRRAEVRPRAARMRNTVNAREADPDTARHSGPVPWPFARQSVHMARDNDSASSCGAVTRVGYGAVCYGGKRGNGAAGSGPCRCASALESACRAAPPPAARLPRRARGRRLGEALICGGSIGLTSVSEPRMGEHLVRSSPDGALLAASLAFAGAAGLGSAVAVRDQLPGEPFGISVPLSVPAGLLAGWGAGIAAPWPMPVAAVIVAARAQRTASSGLAGAICAGVGMGCIVGTVIEPVSWQPRSWTPWTRLAIVCNVAASALLTVAGWRHFTAARAS